MNIIQQHSGALYTLIYLRALENTDFFDCQGSIDEINGILFRKQKPLRIITIGFRGYMRRKTGLLSKLVNSINISTISKSSFLTS